MDTSSDLGSKRLNIALVYDVGTIHRNLVCTPDLWVQPPPNVIESISSALEKLGYNVVHLPNGVKSLVQSLSKGQEKEWDLVFNYFNGVDGLPEREAQIPALLEAYDIPFTFSDAASRALCIDKAKMKAVLTSYGIPTAPFVLIPHDERDEDYSKYTVAMNANYPLFAKQDARGRSAGISSDSKIENPSQLNSTIERLKMNYPDDDILVETYLAGREFTVGIIGTGKAARVIGVMEIMCSKYQSSNAVQQGTGEGTRVVGFATESEKESFTWFGRVAEEPDMNDPKAILASKVALDAYRVLRCRDLGRIDVRFGSGDRENVAHVMDVNTPPAIRRNRSTLPNLAERNGISYEALLDEVVQNTLKRKLVRSHV